MLLTKVLEQAKIFIKEDEFLKDQNIHFLKIKHSVLINFNDHLYDFVYYHKDDEYFQEKNTKSFIVLKSDLHNDLTKYELEEVLKIINKLEFAFKIK